MWDLFCYEISTAMKKVSNALKFLYISDVADLFAFNINYIVNYKLNYKDPNIINFFSSS